jgi:hypothetical protein
VPSYFAVPGSPFKDDDAAALGPELQHLAESGAGSVEEIVEFARSNPASALHAHLELDRPIDEVAEKWYKHRARVCACSIMVNVYANGQRHAVRAFHNVTILQADTDRPARQYVTVDMVRGNDYLSAQVIERARRELEAWTERYAEYEEVFGPVFAAIRAVP